MKVTVRNLGIIKEGNVHLKPLTIFIGPNNAGKTWLAYALAGILGPYGSREYSHAYIEKQVPTIYEPLDTAIERVLAEGNATIDLRKFADDYGERYFNEVASFARNWMRSFLSTQFAHFDTMDVLLSLSDTRPQFLNQVSQYSLLSRIASGPKGSLLTLRKRRGEDTLYVYTASEVQDAEGQEELIGKKIPPEEVRERVVNSVFTALRRSLYPQIRIFPTERTTFVTDRFSANIAARDQSWVYEGLRSFVDELVKKSNKRTLAQPISTIGETTWPVSSFLSMLSDLFSIGSSEKKEREKNARNDPRIKKYTQLAEDLEKQILAGTIDFSTLEPDPRREILFQPTQDVTLELPIASSTVKELAPLVLYLRYLAQPDELLIIDEPEMNLHPAVQVKIIEFLAVLVNAGLRVLITTHSPYILDHLVNLIRAAEYEEEDQESIVDQFFLRRSDAFIFQDDVSIYLIDHGETENILKDEKINWGTFGDVSDRVASIHYEL